MNQQNQAKTPGRDPFKSTDLDYFEVLNRAQRARGEAFANTVERAVRAIRRWIGDLVERASRRQHTIDELNALDDRMLRDIGITRGDIPFVANRVSDHRGTGNDNGAQAA